MPAPPTTVWAAGAWGADCWAADVWGAAVAAATGPPGLFRRPLWSWPRTWDWRPTVSRVPPTTLAKTVTESRRYLVSFADSYEVQAGESLSAPALLPTGGPAGLTISALAVSDQAFDGIAAGEGVLLTIAGGTAGATYNFAVRVASSGGGTLVVPCRLVVTPDYDAA